MTNVHVQEPVNGVCSVGVTDPRTKYCVLKDPVSGKLESDVHLNWRIAQTEPVKTLQLSQQFPCYDDQRCF